MLVLPSQACRRHGRCPWSASHECSCVVSALVVNPRLCEHSPTIASSLVCFDGSQKVLLRMLAQCQLDESWCSFLARVMVLVQPLGLGSPMTVLRCLRAVMRAVTCRHHESFTHAIAVLMPSTRGPLAISPTTRVWHCCRNGGFECIGPSCVLPMMVRGACCGC